jgi:hypothetical protein
MTAAEQMAYLSLVLLGLLDWLFGLFNFESICSIHIRDATRKIIRPGRVLAENILGGSTDPVGIIYPESYPNK